MFAKLFEKQLFFSKKCFIMFETCFICLCFFQKMFFTVSTNIYIYILYYIILYIYIYVSVSFFSEHCFNILFLIHIFRNMFNYLVSFPFSIFLVSLELLLLVELHAPDWRFSICLRIVLVVFSDACSFPSVFWLRSRTA